MKKIPILALALVTAFALTSVASAKQKADKPMGMGPCPMMDMDKDKDGNISAAEWDEFHKAMFTKLDKDGNGSLSNDEVRACPGPGRPDAGHRHGDMMKGKAPAKETE